MRAATWRLQCLMGFDRPWVHLSTPDMAATSWKDARQDQRLLRRSSPCVERVGTSSAHACIWEHSLAWERYRTRALVTVGRGHVTSGTQSIAVSSLDLSAAGSALASSSRRALTRALLTSEVNSCSLVCCLQVAVVSRPKSPHTLRMSLVDIFVFATSANTSACSSCSGRSASSSIRRRSALADILARFPKNLPVPIACSRVAVSKEALNTNKCWRKAEKRLGFGKSSKNQNVLREYEAVSLGWPANAILFLPIVNLGITRNCKTRPASAPTASNIRPPNK